MMETATKNSFRLPNEEEQALKKAMLQAWVDDRARLLLQHPFTASLALHLELIPVVDSRLPTAATDGERVFFNPLFLQELNPDNRLFVLAHEVWHCVAKHFDRALERDHRLWNLATDHEVNSLLVQDGFSMPSNAVLFKKYLAQHPDTTPSAENIFEWLQANPKEAGLQQSFDLHNPIAGDHSAKKGGGSGEECEENEQWVLDPNYAPGSGGEQVKREWQERLVAASQASQQYGNLPETLKRWINERVIPQVPWQQTLRQFVQRTYGGSRSWNRPSRRHLHRKVILPGMQGSRLQLVVALDISGSTADELPAFVSELKSLLTSFDKVELTLIQCSTEITHEQQLSSEDLHKLDDFEVVGGGGTSLIPPFERAASMQPDCFIYLTDGFGPAPAHPPSYPVLWVLTEDGEQPAEWGNVVYLNNSTSD